MAANRWQPVPEDQLGHSWSLPCAANPDSACKSKQQELSSCLTCPLPSPSNTSQGQNRYSLKMYEVIQCCWSPAGTYRPAVNFQPGAGLSWPSDTSLKLSGSELFVLLQELPWHCYRAFAAPGEGGERGGEGRGGRGGCLVLLALAKQLLPAV